VKSEPVRISRRSALALAAGSAAFAAPTTTTQFLETRDIFANPHRGWMTQQRRPGDRPSRVPVSVAYLRVDWADLEPEEGRYNWAVFDGAIAAWRPHGVRIAIRVMTANAHSRGYYSSPKWLFDAGCKGFEYTVGGDDPTSGGVRIARIEPDYSDPIYLEKHSHFLHALAGRYDGHSRMEFADIGSYGIWGEWHTKHPAPFEVRRRIIDMYTENFRRLPLAFMSDDAEGLDYALSKGAGFRRDGVGSDWHAKNWIGSKKYQNVGGFATAWQHAPAVFEWFGDWEYLKRRGWSFAESVQFMLDNHVTYINDNIGKVPDADVDLVRELERRSGYRFVLRRADQSVKGRELVVTTTWSNVGVAPVYREYYLEVSLVDESARMAAKARGADVRRWFPGDLRTEVRLTAPRGTYGVFAAIVDAEGTPSIRLACDAPEEGLRYRIGNVRI
jgi:hypothetical protein